MPIKMENRLKDLRKKILGEIKSIIKAEEVVTFKDRHPLITIPYDHDDDYGNPLYVRNAVYAIETDENGEITIETSDYDAQTINLDEINTDELAEILDTIKKEIQ